MKYVLITVMWMLLLTAPAVAQNGPDVEVSNLEWTHDVNGKHRVRANFARTPAPSPEFVQEVSAVFRNTGTKVVRFVTWEYVIYKDSDPAKAERVYKFRNKVPLGPGESARASKQGFGIQHRRRVEARVVRVEYADGSIWRRERFELPAVLIRDGRGS